MEGDCIIKSLPFCVFGKAITSRDIFRFSQSHEDPLNPEGDPPMGRGSILKGLGEKSKFPEPLLGQSLDFEDLFLEGAIVNSLGTSTHFIPINHNIVGMGADLKGIGVKEVDIFGEGHCERVVDNFESPFIGVPFKEGEIAYP